MISLFFQHSEDLTYSIDIASPQQNLLHVYSGVKKLEIPIIMNEYNSEEHESNENTQKESNDHFNNL
jgi:hypothetical protein